MTQTLRSPNGLKIMFSVVLLVYLLYLYAGFLSDLGDLYPDIIWDEIVDGLLGIGIVVLWYRVTTKWLKR